MTRVGMKGNENIFYFPTYTKPRQISTARCTNHTAPSRAYKTKHNTTSFQLIHTNSNRMQTLWKIEPRPRICIRTQTYRPPKGIY